MHIWLLPVKPSTLTLPQAPLYSGKEWQVDFHFCTGSPLEIILCNLVIFPHYLYTHRYSCLWSSSKIYDYTCLPASFQMKRCVILISQWSLEVRSSLTLWLDFPDSAKPPSQVVNSVKTNTLSVPSRALDLNNTMFLLQGNTSASYLQIFLYMVFWKKGMPWAVMEAAEQWFRVWPWIVGSKSWLSHFIVSLWQVDFSKTPMLHL